MGSALRTALRSTALSSLHSGKLVKSSCSCSPSWAICFKHLWGIHGEPSTHRATPNQPRGLSTRRPSGPAENLGPQRRLRHPPRPNKSLCPWQDHPPLDGAGILVQPSHALQGGRIGHQVWGEAGIFHHEEHVKQLFEGGLGRPSQAEGLGWPSPLPQTPLQLQNQAAKGH